MMETIEEKTYRLVNKACGSTITTFEAALDNVAFLHTCKAIELAIAEERERCAQICDDLHDMWRFGDGDESTSGPMECAHEIRKQCVEK